MEADTSFVEAILKLFDGRFNVIFENCSGTIIRGINVDEGKIFLFL